MLAIVEYNDSPAEILKGHSGKNLGNTGGHETVDSTVCHVT